MNGTTGLASWRMTGPAHTIATRAAIGQEPTDATAARQPAKAVNGRTCPASCGSPRAATTKATSIPIRSGARNRPKPPRSPIRSVSFRTAATIDATRASAIELNGRRRAARARTSPAPSSSTTAARIRSAAGTVTLSWPSTPVSASPGSNPSASDAWSMTSPSKNADSPTTPTRSRAINSRSRSCRPSTAGMVREGLEREGWSGGGARTRDIQVGNLALHQLSYARLSVHRIGIDVRVTPGTDVRAVTAVDEA